MAGFETKKVAAFEVKKDDIDFSRYMLLPEDPARIVPTDTPGMLDELCDLSFGKKSKEGMRLPWPKYHDEVRFQPGKVSLWGGYTHHGKTHVLKQLMLSGIASGTERVCIASMEETPSEALFDIACMALQDRNPPRDALDVFLGWTQGKLFFFDWQALIEPGRILGVANYAATELKCTQFVADSLMRLDIEGDDYEAQRVFGNLMGLHARRSNLHLHLVAHVRKGDEAKIPNLYDTKGAGDLVNQVDKVFLTWRNKKPRADREKGKDIMADGVLVVDKQRGRPNWIGRIPTYYHYPSTQLVTGEAEGPRSFIPGIGTPKAATQEMF
jgi:twinkle protein